MIQIYINHNTSLSTLLFLKSLTKSNKLANDSCGFKPKIKINFIRKINLISSNDNININKNYLLGK